MDNATQVQIARCSRCYAVVVNADSGYWPDVEAYPGHCCGAGTQAQWSIQPLAEAVGEESALERLGPPLKCFACAKGLVGQTKVCYACAKGLTGTLKFGGLGPNGDDLDDDVDDVIDEIWECQCTPWICTCNQPTARSPWLVWCPLCGAWKNQSTHLRKALPDVRVRWFANMVTHYRHEHRKWDAQCDYLDRQYGRESVVYEAQKRTINEQAKRQILRHARHFLRLHRFRPEHVAALQHTEAKTLELAYKLLNE